MTVSHSAKPPKASKNGLIAFLLTDENLKSTQELIKKGGFSGPDCGKDAWKKDEKEFFLSSGLKAIAIGLGKSADFSAEKVRKVVTDLVEFCNENSLENLHLVLLPGAKHPETWPRAQAEALILSNYQFLVYKSDKKTNSLKVGTVYSEAKNGAVEVAAGIAYAEATCIARDLVNEPVITLTAPELGNRAKNIGKKYGIKTEVLNKAKIESLKMGGLLSVNLGSPLPPVFIVMEYKPAKPKNKNPIVFVGKGIVYDTGGLSLKPTAQSMDFMKCDMAGGATAIAALAGIASMKLPYHVITLVPATDNRPGQNAYTPGDVITMYDGTTVEVLNTDAEGRLVLADALTYAKKYKPELVIDLATLTGAAVIALGNQGIALMSNADEITKNKLKTSGNAVYERLAELPLWEEYGEQLKSDIADLKNIGGKGAGTITAGKFLEHFTDYPWAHLDIATMAFLHSADSYRGKNGTGIGVRLLINFVENY